MKNLVLFCLLFIGKIAFSQTIYETILPRINTDAQTGIGTAALDANITNYKASLQSNGRWLDITNYGNSPDGTHLFRVMDMARGYTRSGSTYQNDITVYNAIVLALTAWYNLNPKNSNWWYNDISYPKTIGQILILMRYGSPKLSTSLENNLINRMRIVNFKTGDGANTSDEALHYLYRAVLSQNINTLDSAATFSFEGITYGFSEGLSYDNSFTAHGRQLSINGYGEVFVLNNYNVAGYLDGTSYALSSQKKAMLNNFYQNTYVKSGRGSFRDFNTLGRGISRGSGIGHVRTTGVNAYYLADVRLADPAKAAVWDSIAAGTYQVKPIHNRYFWSDYDLHIRAGYTIGLRTVSSRSIRTERGNNENKLGKFLPDGATSIQRIGPEYQNIYPIWEWDKIPGTTARDFNNDTGATLTTDWGTSGSTAFVGGATDSLYAATAYDMNYNSVRAKKAYFFFNDEVVCLGAGITSTEAESIITSVNQCWLYGGIKVNNGGITSTIDSTANSSSAFTSPNWVQHDNIGYFFPSGGNITLSNKIQNGNWNRINSSQSTTALSGTVFNMWFNHGVKPTNAKYAYIIVPNLATATDMQNYNAANIRIVKNTDSAQVVRHLGLDMMQVIFYKAGNLTDSTISISVSNPCVLLFKNLHSANVIVSIADPSQQNTSIKLSFVLPGITGGMKSLIANLPSGNLAGKSARYILNANTSIPIPNSLIALADAYVRDGSAYATTNYGTVGSLTVKKDGVGYSREAFFKFDPRGIQRPVSNAKLRIYLSYANTQTSSVQWALYQSNTNWAETGINWNNKPAQQALIEKRQGQISTGYVDWDITTLVNSLSPDSLLSFQLLSTVANGQSDAIFNSRETSNQPTIVLDNTPPLATSISVDADAFVKSGTANINTNFGYNSYMVAQNAYYESFLKFDLNNLSGKIIGAKLKLYTQSTVATQWQLYKVNNNSWTEGGLTWNNKPIADTLLKTINAPADMGYVYWDISNQVKHTGTDGFLSLKIVAAANVYSSFSTKQNSDVTRRPIIEYLVDTTGVSDMMFAKADMIALKTRLKETLTTMKSPDGQTINEQETVLPSNLITPNGDGRNDNWYIKNIANYKDNIVKVFSRDGKLIYSRKGYDNDWDGTYNGAPLNDGVYLYIIEVGKNIPLIKGTLTVIKGFR